MHAFRGKIVAVLQIRLHQLFVYLDHLLDDLGVRIGNARQGDGFVEGGEEAVDHLGSVGSRKIDGQALLSEGIGDLRHQRLEVEFLAVNLVDDNHAAEAALTCRFHDAPGVGADPGAGIDDHCDRLHRGERG